MMMVMIMILITASCASFAYLLRYIDAAEGGEARRHLQQAETDGSSLQEDALLPMDLHILLMSR